MSEYDIESGLRRSRRIARIGPDVQFSNGDAIFPLAVATAITAGVTYLSGGAFPAPKDNTKEGFQSYVDNKGVFLTPLNQKTVKAPVNAPHKPSYTSN